MSIAVATDNAILSISKSLKRFGLAIIWLQLVVIIWIVYSLFSAANVLTFSFLLLALGMPFLLYRYRSSLPKNNTDVGLFRHEKYKRPTLLRALLAIQIVALLYGAYSAYAWAQLYYINLLKLSSLYNTLALAIFLALHLAIIVNTAFWVKLLQANMLINNTLTADSIKTKLKKLYPLALVFCIAALFFLLYKLIPTLPTTADSISHLASSAQLVLLIYLVQIALAVLLVYFIVRLFQRKKVSEIFCLYKWLVAVLAIDIYISMGIAENGVRALLEFPEIIAPTIFSIIAECLLLAILIGISTYTSLNAGVEDSQS